MLPSMPLLLTPMKELRDESSSSSDDSPTHNSIENGLNDRLVNSPLSGFAADNSVETGGNGTMLSQEEDQAQEKSRSPEKRESSEPTSAQKKKKKKNQHKKMLAALELEGNESRDASAQTFAEAYYQKVRNRLDDEKWSKFVQELTSFEELPEAERKPVDLYHKMEQLLSPDDDLVEEFLKFLLPHQALEVDRVMTYFSLDKMSEFFRKLNILLMKRQVRQVYAALESLSVMSNVTLSDVYERVLPLIKSSSLLTNLFLSLLPGERPPDSLMTDFEQVNLKEESEFETILVPDCPDPYGCENCACHCHKTQTRHCVACGIKYLNGRVYIQCGKALRPAKVMFKDKKHLDLLKWEEEKSRNRRRLLPKTMLSPGSFDHRLNADSEDDCGVKKSPRTPRMRVTRPKACKKDTNRNKEEEVLEGIFPLAVSKNGDNNTEEIVDSEMKPDGTDEHDFDEIVLENECNTEEDEEEYLNKGLNSENDSSIEAEDIAKELECSFEDEEVDDFDNIEIDISENSTNHKDNERLKLTNEELSDSNYEDLSKSNEVEAGSAAEENLQGADSGLGTSSPAKNYLDDMKIEPMSVKSALEADEPVKAEIPDQLEDGINLSFSIKSEEITDVYSEQCTDNDINMELPSGSGTSQVDSAFKEWTKEEDKIILLTFQHESGLEQTFKTASLQLPNRSQEEIQQRFEVLLNLLKEMYPNSEPLTHNK